MDGIAVEKMYNARSDLVAAIPINSSRELDRTQVGRSELSPIQLGCLKYLAPEVDIDSQVLYTR